MFCNSCQTACEIVIADCANLVHTVATYGRYIPAANNIAQRLFLSCSSWQAPVQYSVTGSMHMEAVFRDGSAY